MTPGPLLDSLTSSRTSSHSNLSTTRPRPAIPIIPIIPRKLEKKRRQSPREAKLIIPNDSGIEECIEWKADTPLVQDGVPSEEGGVDLNHEPLAQGTPHQSNTLEMGKILTSSQNLKVLT